MTCISVDSTLNRPTAVRLTASMNEAPVCRTTSMLGYKVIGIKYDKALQLICCAETFVNIITQNSVRKLDVFAFKY